MFYGFWQHLDLLGSRSQIQILSDSGSVTLNYFLTLNKKELLLQKCQRSNINWLCDITWGWWGWIERSVSVMRT